MIIHPGCTLAGADDGSDFPETHFLKNPQRHGLFLLLRKVPLFSSISRSNSLFCNSMITHYSSMFSAAGETETKVADNNNDIIGAAGFSRCFFIGPYANTHSGGPIKRVV